MALVKIHNDLLLGCTDSNQLQHHSSLLVLLDLSAAFDTLTYNQLLIILNQQFGIDDKVQKWLESILKLAVFFSCCCWHTVSAT